MIRELLLEATFKDGLVKKVITVKQDGKIFKRTYWVKPSSEKSNTGLKKVQYIASPMTYEYTNFDKDKAKKRAKELTEKYFSPDHGFKNKVAKVAAGLFHTLLDRTIKTGLKDNIKYIKDDKGKIVGGIDYMPPVNTERIDRVAARTTATKKTYVEYLAADPDVLESGTHKGIGKKLLVDLFKECLEQDSMILLISTTISRPFYKKMGFKAYAGEFFITPEMIKKQLDKHLVKESQQATYGIEVWEALYKEMLEMTEDDIVVGDKGEEIEK
jgi:GNAT superfamily N-acetyltransferase